MGRTARSVLLGVAVLVVVAVVAAIVALPNLFVATQAPGPLETAVALRVRNLSIPRADGRAANPLASNPDAWRAGGTHFEDHCAVCHNNDGRGGGEIGPNMNPRVPDLTSARTQGLTDGQLYYIIANGVRWTGMPAFRNEHTPEETWQLVSFIRRLPKLTEDQLDELQKAAGEDEPAGHHEHEAASRPDEQPHRHNQ